MTFVKGKSGNPGGRPKQVLEVKELARKYTSENIERLAQIARGSDNESASVAAIRELLDRAWGKAPQEIKADVSLRSLPDEQLEARFRAIIASTSIADPPKESAE